MTSSISTPQLDPSLGARAIDQWMASVGYELSALFPVWDTLADYHDERRFGLRPDPIRNPPGIRAEAGHDLPQSEEWGTGYRIITRASAVERPGMLACAVCGNPLELARRGAPRKTCSDACRKALSRQQRVAKAK